MSADSPISRFSAGAARLRRGALWVIFGSILMIPKVNRLRRHRRAWNYGRIVAGLAGAAMIGVGALGGHIVGLLVAGSALLLFALLLAPERREMSIDARARELGALIVVDGGNYIDAAGAPNRAKLFVGSDRLWVLDAALSILLDLPFQQVRAILVEPAGADWKLRLDCGPTTAEFVYQGNFGEHLARVAEATLRSRLYRELPVLH